MVYIMIIIKDINKHIEINFILIYIYSDVQIFIYI